MIVYTLTFIQCSVILVKRSYSVVCGSSMFSSCECWHSVRVEVAIYRHNTIRFSSAKLFILAKMSPTVTNSQRAMTRFSVGLDRTASGLVGAWAV